MGLDDALVVEHRLGGGNADRLGGAGDVDDDSGGDRAGPERRPVVVARPNDHLAAGREAQRLRDLCAQRSDDITGSADLGQLLAVQTRGRDQLVGPCAPVHVVDKRR